MIRSFRGKEAEEIWRGNRLQRYALDLQIRARRKLRMLNNARTLADLRVPPGNRLEALKGERKGQYSVRVNDQYRICFQWEDGDCLDVELTDYH